MANICNASTDRKIGGKKVVLVAISLSLVRGVALGYRQVILGYIYNYNYNLPAFSRGFQIQTKVGIIFAED